jgi:hypothetical protein
MSAGQTSSAAMLFSILRTPSTSTTTIAPSPSGEGYTPARSPSIRMWRWVDACWALLSPR